MANQLFNELNNINIDRNQSNNLLTQFYQFKKTFNGNPQQIVQNLLNSGRMSQQQFNQLQQMANQIQKLMR